MSDSKLNFDYLLKFIIIGDSAVGKSNILMRYTNNHFSNDFQSTIPKINHEKDKFIIKYYS